MIKKLILFYPSSESDFEGKDIDFEIPGIPIGIMSLAAYIESKGYEVKLIDSRLYDKNTSKNMLFNEINEETIVGISATTSQVKHGYIISKEIKNKFSKTKIVWGGIHPTLYPEQTIKGKYVDFVINGEGEYGLLELIKQLNLTTPDFSKVPSLIYLKRSKIIQNQLTFCSDINELPDPSYHLLEIEKYTNRELYFYDMNKKYKTIDINTSRGCPYRCSFCTNTINGFKNWRPLDAKRVNKLIDKLITKYKVEHIWFMDDYFFGNKERVKEIINHLIKKKYNLTWEANARANLFRNNYFTKEFIKLIKKSGCIQLRMGIESGSNRVLKILKKDIFIDDAITATKKLKKYKIRSNMYFMGGIPGETKEEFIQTIKLMINLKKIDSNSLIQGPGLFRPYPGTELYKECKKLGFEEPKTLEEWTKINLTNNFGINEKDIQWVDFAPEVITSEITVFNFMYGHSNNSRNKKLSITRIILYYIALLRLKTNFFKIPMEKKLLEIKQRMTKK